MRLCNIGFFLFLLIYGLISVTWANEGRKPHLELDEKAKFLVTQRIEEVKQEVLTILSPQNEFEIRCITEKLLFALYRYMLMFIKIVSAFNNDICSAMYNQYTESANLLESITLCFRSCLLIPFSKAKGFSDFVNHNAKVSVLNDLEMAARNGPEDLFKMIVSQYLQVNDGSLFVTTCLVYMIDLMEDRQLRKQMNVAVSVIFILFRYLEDAVRTVEKMDDSALHEFVEKKKDVVQMYDKKLSGPDKEISDMQVMLDLRVKRQSIIQSVGERAQASKKPEDGSELGISNVELFTIESMALQSIWAILFITKNLYTFFEMVLQMIKDSTELETRLRKMIQLKGLELNLDEVECAEIRLELYNRLDLDNLRRLDVMYHAGSARVTHQDLQNIFQKQYSILSKILKQLEKKNNKHGNNPYVAILLQDLIKLMKEVLASFKKLLAGIGSSLFKLTLEYENDEKERTETKVKGRKKKTQPRRIDQPMNVESEVSSEVDSSEKRKSRGKGKMRRRLEYLPSSQDILGAQSSVMDSTKDEPREPESQMDTGRPETPEEPKRTEPPKPSRKEMRLKKLLDKEAKSDAMQKIKDTIQEQKSSMESKKKRKQLERKGKQEEKREKEKREREEERERERQRERERLARVEQTNFMYSLLNSVDSIEGLFKEVEKSQEGMAPLISFVFGIISDEVKMEDSDSDDGLVGAVGGLTLSDSDKKASTHTPPSTSGRGKRRADEVPGSGPKVPTAKFFETMVSGGTRDSARDRRARERPRSRERSSSRSRKGSQTQSALSFDGFSFSDLSVSGSGQDEPISKSRFMKFFSKGAGDDKELPETKQRSVRELCLVDDVTYSNINENSTFEEIKASLEECGLEIQRLHLEVAPFFANDDYLAIKLLEKDLISAFIRLLILLQQKR
ncbi:putative secreted signal peptide-containing protein [Cryptosporidium canis]|uniref:Secreted signal peptide-containing protein n=1 Tax=Cryptosporidium canis TaxID=195482 RepID=A0A9D5HXI6_9CRYT|nr:putative secreted signal peptide-containing protein [Cryptosporidium canis]